MIPRSRMGGEYKHNLFPWKDGPHAAWHCVFRHMTIREVWAVFDEVHSKIFNTAGKSVIPSWWRVCPFIPKEAHIPKKPVETDFLIRAWLECFGTSRLEKSRVLLKMMLLFFIFDGALYDAHTTVSTERLKRLIYRLRPGSQRHWAFKVCFDEEPKGDCGQIAVVKRAIEYIFLNSPYVPSK